MLKGKTVVVGVCGGIAAYKILDVVSRLKKLHADVHVIMTGSATKFVTPLSFQSISQNLVTVEMFDEPKSWDIKHISLAQKADLVLVAPATANVLGKVAHGIADDMLTTTIMATKAPVLFVPAMNTVMYENPILQENIQKLISAGYHFLEPDRGRMACGTSGKGRLPEPEKIVEQAKSLLCAQHDLEGINILVTAGPTQEPMDPVRYITNRSSGKMGYAIAMEAYARGARVKVISGPVAVACSEGIEMEKVATAQEMYEGVMGNIADFDVFIMVAAVADYKCLHVSDQKIKKKDENLVLELVRNPDIAKEVGKVKGDKILVGFSAETEALLTHAKEKLESKNMDLIVANDVTAEGAGFGVDTNIVKLIRRDGNITELPIMSKKEVAGRILDEVLKIKSGK